MPPLHNSWSRQFWWNLCRNSWEQQKDIKLAIKCKEIRTRVSTDRCPTYSGHSPGWYQTHYPVSHHLLHRAVKGSRCQLPCDVSYPLLVLTVLIGSHCACSWNSPNCCSIWIKAVFHVYTADYKNCARTIGGTGLVCWSPYLSMCWCEVPCTLPR